MELHIVLWQDSTGVWHEQTQGVFADRELAEWLIKCKRASGEPYPFAIVSGAVVEVLP